MEGDESMYQASFHRSSVPSVLLDSAGRVIDLNDAYLAMSGRSRPDMIGASTIDLIHADDLPGVITGLDRLMGGAPVVRHRRRHRMGDGSWLPIEAATCLMPAPPGEAAPILVQILDHRIDAVQIDSDDELATRQLYQPAGDGACIHDAEGRVAFASPTLDSLVGRTEGWMIGRRLTDTALDAVLADGTPATADDDPAVRAIRTSTEVTATIGVRTADGARIWLSVVVGPVEREALPARSSLRDITELVEAQEEARRLAELVEQQLTYRADHDDLTGLTARRVVMAELDEHLAAGRSVSVVFVDLDGFKAVNDELGHIAGDDVLIAVAQRLTDLAPASMTVARAGGDEFLAITPRPEDADDFAAEVRRAGAGGGGLATSGPHRVRASVGVAHSMAADTRTDLLSRADQAMYGAKRNRRAGSDQP